MDLKIPKALSNRVFNNGYSKHFRAVAFLWGVRGCNTPPPLQSKFMEIGRGGWGLELNFLWFQIGENF